MPSGFLFCGVILHMATKKVLNTFKTLFVEFFGDFPFIITRRFLHYITNMSLPIIGFPSLCRKDLLMIAKRIQCFPVAD